MREQVEVLKNHADFGSDPAKERLGIIDRNLSASGCFFDTQGFILKKYPSFGRQFHKIDTPQHGAFSGTAGTDQNDRLSFVNRQIYPF
jgi:hypothetical protein